MPHSITGSAEASPILISATLLCASSVLFICGSMPAARAEIVVGVVDDDDVDAVEVIAVRVVVVVVAVRIVVGPVNGDVVAGAPDD